jgi:hypothetical protein
MINGPRAAKIEELPQIVKLTSWVFGFEKYGLYEDSLLPHVFCSQNIENLRVITVNEEVVSHLAIWEGWLYIYGIRLKVGLVGCVCTHPNHRRKGYASALVKDAFMKMSKDNVDLVMISGARSLYSRAGCVEAGILYDHYIPVTILKDLAMGLDWLKVERYTEGRILDLVNVYQREPVRFKRSLEEFKMLADRVHLEAKGLLNIFISYWADKPISYIALTGGLGQKMMSELTVSEYAGSRIAVIKTLYEASKILSAKYIKLPIPYGDWEFVRLLDKIGLKPKASYAPASLAVLNPVNFIERIRPYVEEKIGVNTNFNVKVYDDCFEIYVLGESIKLEDPKSFTTLIFGKPEIIRNPDAPKFDFSKVPEIFKKAFPMPTVTYGLNYI